MASLYFFLLPQLLVGNFETPEEMVIGRVCILDKSGNLYTDHFDETIRKYSPTGQLLAEMGGKGEGPGYFSRLGWLAINEFDDNLYVTEFRGGHHWISRFTLEGEYLGEWYPELD